MADLTSKRRTGWNGYRQIVSALSDEILRGEITKGALLPTERELCERFGASRPTVRKALSELVEHGLAEKIPNRGVCASVAQGIVRPTRIAWVYHPWPAADAMTRTLTIETAARSYELVPIPISPERGLAGVMDEVEAEDIPAILLRISGPFDTLLIAERERLAKRAAVALEHSYCEPTIDRVARDEPQAGYYVTRTLFHRGAKHVAFAGVFGFEPSIHQRYSGYLFAVQESGCDPEPRNILPCGPGVWGHFDVSHVAERMSQPNRPDAIVLMSEEVIEPVLKVLADLKIVPGRDILLGGIASETTNRYPKGSPVVRLSREAVVGLGLELLEKRAADLSAPPRTARVPYVLGTV